MIFYKYNSLLGSFYASPFEKYERNFEIVFEQSVLAAQYRFQTNFASAT